MPKEQRKNCIRIRREQFFTLALVGMLFILLTIPPLLEASRSAEDEDALSEDADNAAEEEGPVAEEAYDPQIVRVVFPPHSQTVEALSPYGPGFDDELLDAFAQACGFQLEIQQAATVQEAWNLLDNNQADILIGSGYEPPTEQKNAFGAGPAYGEYRPVILRGENVKRLYVKGAVGDRWKHFEENPFLMRANAPLEKRIRSEVPWLDKGTITRVDTRFSPELIFASLQGGRASYALVDSGRLRLWYPFFPDLRTERTLSEPIAYRWYWRSERRDLAVTLNYFWQAAGTKETLRTLKEKYTGFLPKKYDRLEVVHFLKTLAAKMPKYRRKIQHEARRCGIDPLLLVALIYQESRFNSRAVSCTGARGLLQFTSAAASYFKLHDPFNGMESIRAGAEYLRMLWKDLEGSGISQWDRWFFTLAAYNQGKGHLQDAIALSAKLNRKGRTWADLKEVYPKLQQRKYAALVRHGSCRGREAVQYVDNIRYYYFILRGVISLARPEAQDLAPLVGRRLLAAGDGF